MLFVCARDFSYFIDSESEGQLSERDDTLSLPSSNSTFCLDLNVADSIVHITRPLTAKQDQDETDGEAAKSSAREWQSYYCLHVWIILYVLQVLKGWVAQSV